MPRNLWEASAPPVEVAAGRGVSMSLCVLSSSSSGNCSILTIDDGHAASRVMIDAGLSPRRTKRLLGDLGLSLAQISGVIYTHLDSDHCHPGWASDLPAGAWIRMHARHARRSRECGMHLRKPDYFEGEFEIGHGVRATPVLMAHDGLGVAAFRFDSGHGSLGFATDCGRVTRGLVDTLEGVDTLAIESNYCPEMQRSSARPEFLKRRIMGGAGHLSNQECAKAVRHIRPREHVVLLHLSRQCNTPQRAASEHRDAAYTLTIASHDTPTGEIRVGTD